MSELEVFKTIPGYENYSVSNIGRVRDDESGLLVRVGNHNKGYKNVHLFDNNGQCKKYLIHRLVAQAFIPNPENKFFVDHKNGDRADNRLENLRFCTRTENNRNTRIRKNNTTGHKGITFVNKTQKWVARIGIDGKRYHLGTFETLDQAVEARRKKAKEVFGEFLNDCEKEETDIVIRVPRTNTQTIDIHIEPN